MGPSHINDKRQKTRDGANAGQSLVEILVAVTVGFILISGAVTLLTVSLKSSAQNKFIQGASFLSQDLVDRATIFAESKWYCPPAPNCVNDSGQQANYGVYNLQKGSDQHYHLSATAPFTWIDDDEPVNLNGIAYTRYFYLENVSRDGNNNIEPVYNPDNKDPSTQKITVVTSWPASAASADVTFTKYLTRNANFSFAQTDWSGGPTKPADNPVFSPGAIFYEANNIDYGVNGSIKLK